MIAQCYSNRHPSLKEVQESSVMGAKLVVGIDKETQECPIPSTLLPSSPLTWNNLGGPWRRTHLQGHAISRQSTTGIGPKRACLRAVSTARQECWESMLFTARLDSDDHCNCNQRGCLIFPKLGTAPCSVLISKPVSAERIYELEKAKKKARLCYHLKSKWSY